MTKFEDIHKAVYDKLKDLPGVKTVSRRWQHWDDCKQMPAVFLTSRSTTPFYTQHLPPVWTMTIDVTIYVENGGAKNTTPSTLLNAIKDEIRYALRPSKITGVQDLGFEGIVFYCRLGTFDDQEGLMGNISASTGSIEIQFSECY